MSNTGAWGQYYAAGFSYDLPRATLANGLGVSVSGSLGYSRFGDMDAVPEGRRSVTKWRRLQAKGPG